VRKILKATKESNRELRRWLHEITKRKSSETKSIHVPDYNFYSTTNELVEVINLEVNSNEIDKTHTNTDQQIVVKERYLHRMNYYLTAFFIALAISIGIMLFGKIIFDVTINLVNVYLFYTLLTIPLFIFSLNILIYLLPIIEFIIKKKNQPSGIKFDIIIEEQKKPTMRKYLVRKIFLITFFVLGIIATLGNIILFIVESVI